MTDLPPRSAPRPEQPPPPPHAGPLRVLVLGGTGEARALAALLADDPRFAATVSLAGRTQNPIALPLPTRVGGFGGIAGLVDWLRANATGAVVDATHPYAARISANAVAAAAALDLPLASLVRPAWPPEPGDRWIPAASFADAAQSIGAEPRRVFLTVGRLELSAFATAPQHTYVARTIEPAGDIALPPRLALVRDRGPFGQAAEAAFLARHAIEVVVSKNSGGGATYAKISAARALGLPVVMVDRPAKPAGVPVASPAAAILWLGALQAHRAPPSLEPDSSRRGV